MRSSYQSKKPMKSYRIPSPKAGMTNTSEIQFLIKEREILLQEKIHNKKLLLKESGKRSLERQSKID